MSEGILLVKKPRGCTSFYLVALLRKRLGIQKIGHTGTLDPFATGLMVMLVGKKYTRKADSFLHDRKTYRAKALLGVTTDTYDCDGQTTSISESRPSKKLIEEVILSFQGKALQTPPMFSAKKQKGKKLYELARQGLTVARAAMEVDIKISEVVYSYPYLEFTADVSKGTYIRSLAHDVGQSLGCGAHLVELERLANGCFFLENAIDIEKIKDTTQELSFLEMIL